jgi:hypothetical protein
MAWEIETTDEYDAWFLKQSADSQASIQMKVEFLKEYGPNLPRPHADTLKGSKLSNLKELRAQTTAHVFRVAFLLTRNARPFCLSAGTRKEKMKNGFTGA